MRLDAYANAAFALNDAGNKPAQSLLTRQSFLLIACTQHVVTVPPESDVTSSVGYTGVPAFSQIL